MSSDVAAAKVGLFLIVALAALFGALLFLQGDIGQGGGYELHVAFPDAQGLMRGDRVRMAGVNIGEVKDVRLVHDDPEFRARPATATLWVRDQYRIYENDHFSIRTGGLIGERFVAVTRDYEAKAGRVLKPGDKRKGDATAGMGELFDQANELMTSAGSAMQELDATIVLAGRTFEHVNSIVGDPAIRQQLVSAMQRLDAAMARAGAVMDETYALVRDARGIVGEKDEKVDELLVDLKETTASLRRASAGVNAFISTTTIPQNLDAASLSVRETTASAQRTAETIETLVTDSKTQSDVRETLDNLRRATEQGAEAAEKANRLLGRAEGVADRAVALSRRARDIEVTAAVDVQVGDHEAWRSDVNIDLRPYRESRTFYRLGVRDVGDTNQLNLQHGRDLGDGQRLRLGLIDSELGVGYDRSLGDRIALEADLYRPDKPELDLRAVYHYNETYDLLFGVDNALRRRNIFLGGRRKLDF